MSKCRWAVVILAASLVVAAVAVAAAYAAGLAQASLPGARQAKVSAPKVIRAQRFEVVDEKGVDTPEELERLRRRPPSEG